MCGFAGILAAAGDSPDPGMLQRMGSVLRHRGPDDGGLAVAGRCGLVHRRLSIIDLSIQGRQPMRNEDGSVWIAYNGEVYNFRELRRERRLDERGHVFRSKTDTEVLLHLYEEMGEDMLPLLNGMFALAIWDRGRDALLLARDAYGIKPLFHCSHGGAFAFASEIKALLRMDGFRPVPDELALHHYLSFDFVPGGLTAFEGIEELRPGHSILIDRSGAVRVRRFAGLDYMPDHTITERDAVAESSRLLRESVRRQLVSDVPVGVMLSGGMDSSALTALMSSVRGDPGFHTFSLRFGEKSFDESPWARMVARRVGTTHHTVDVTAGLVRDGIATAISHIDEPYADGSAIPTMLLAREARKHVTVLLSGEGGDEFFGGYDTHAALEMRRRYRMLVPGFVRRGLVRPLVGLLPVSRRKLSFEFKAKRFVRGCELDVPSAHFSWRMVLSEDEKRRVMRTDSSSHPPSVGLFRQAYEDAPAEDDLARILYIDYAYHLPDDLMIKNDRMTMASSMEARVPFTDNDLVGFLCRVPSAVKLPGLRRKHLLKEAMEGVLPAPVLRKKKVGLEIPYSDWMRGELRDVFEEELGESRIASCPLLEPAGVRALWREHLESRADNGRALWGILNYLVWYRSYITSGSYMSLLEPGGPVPDVLA